MATTSMITSLSLLTGGMEATTGSTTPASTITPVHTIHPLDTGILQELHQQQPLIRIFGILEPELLDTELLDLELLDPEDSWYPGLLEMVLEMVMDLGMLIPW